METTILELVNTVRVNKGLPPLAVVQPESRLRQDLGFDSFDLAELTVRIEEVWKLDIFADGLVHTVGEVMAKIARVGKVSAE
jgi:acyl carrier protein